MKLPEKFPEINTVVAKKVLTGLVAVILVVTILNFTLDLTVRAAVTVVGTRMLGAPMRIEGLSIGIIRPSVVIRGMKIYNPSGFPKGILLDIAKIKVRCRLGDILRKKMRFREIYLHLREVGIIKNKDGILNVDSLKVVQKESAAEESGKKPAESFPMSIDELTLTLDKVVYKDYTGGDIPDIKVYELGVREKTYRDIKSAEELVVLLLIEGMKPTMIKSAAVYGAAAVLGVAFLPVGIALALTADDNSEEVLNVDIKKAYNTCLDIMGKIGVIKEQYDTSHSIVADVKGVKVTVDMSRVSRGKTEITVSARKFFLPRPEVAGGVLYHIAESLGAR